MTDNDNRMSRRNVLKVAGASVATAAGSGLAAAKSDDTVEVNVGFASGRGRQKALATADDVVRKFNSIDVVTIRATKHAVQALDKNPNIRYVEENGTMHALAQTLPWGQDRVDSDVLHANGELGNGADIAIIDTGIDDDHPDLTDHLGKGKAFVSCNTRGGCRYGAKPADNTCNYSWTDDNNHGTHCAGIAAGDDNSQGIVGAAPDATLHAVKVLDKCGSGSFSDIAAGVEYVADQGWDVGSMSLGASSGSSALKDAVQYATDKGVFLVAAAGNSGPCSDCVGYPAAYSEVMAVSSTASDDSLSDFSSTGPEVEIAAPGTDIYSTIASNAGYDTYSGTSMACPHVAGVAGQLTSNGTTGSDIRTQLKNTAENIGLASNESGAGLLDAAAALGYDSSDDT
ncbi:S8 family serine peptidase [Halorussus sp. MSC15.2]|uniref:S8 family serine peptidase n=1 Tax=Halorussus sp. MSC15.2 TaxID=2283638 RepID=UPI0013D170BD|nr:S8 family serine peptidase [Halorussus sp. MSC15.2]NEU57278.1 S8 family serine peptidase [Halorussus sp. MSC15.2]